MLILGGAWAEKSEQFRSEDQYVEPIKVVRYQAWYSGLKNVETDGGLLFLVLLLDYIPRVAEISNAIDCIRHDLVQSIQTDEVGIQVLQIRLMDPFLA